MIVPTESVNGRSIIVGMGNSRPPRPIGVVRELDVRPDVDVPVAGGGFV